MGFKEDADFARFLSMGALGTAAVAQHLRSQLGHAPVELERYAMSNKVWQTKVKRLRLPDIVCTRCGLRVESRAKSKLAIVLSDSNVPGREWDGGGMRDDDLYAFVRVDLRSPSVEVGTPVYFNTSALRRALGQARRSSPKAASEGSEITMTWPSWVAKRNGRVVEIDAEDRIVCHWADGKTYRYWHWRDWGPAKQLYVEPGSRIIAEDTIVAGVVEKPSILGCPGETWDLNSSMLVLDTAERYAAVKVAGLLRRYDLNSAIASIAKSSDWRLRLEAHASLAQLEPDLWINHIVDIVEDAENTSEQQIEAVFVLSEIPSHAATMALSSIAANRSLDSELRAAAAWGIGQGPAANADLLLPLIADSDRLVALHAITAIEQITDSGASQLRHCLEAEAKLAAPAARVLQRLGRIEELLDACEQSESRGWALRALGDLPPDEVRKRAGSRLTDELTHLLEPIWLGQTDWLRSDDGKAGLDSLDVQKVQASPTLL